MKKSSAEEKLLHIIEGSKARNKVASGAVSAGPPDFLKKITIRKPTLRDANKILIGIAVVITVVLIFHFVKEREYLAARFDRKKSAEELEKSLVEIGAKRDVPGTSEYLTGVEKNNPFHMLPVVQKPQIKADEQVNLKLVGIIWSDDAPQAILEDGVSKQNYLVYEGDTVDKFKVNKITSTEVHLVSEDGEKILR